MQKTEIPEIETTQRTVNVFMVNGHEFRTREEAEAYIYEEHKHLHYTYYAVLTDLKDGAYQRLRVLAVKGRNGKDDPYYRMNLVSNVLNALTTEHYHRQADVRAWNIAQQSVFDTTEGLIDAMNTWKTLLPSAPYPDVMFLDENNAVEEYSTSARMMNNLTAEKGV